MSYLKNGKIFDEKGVLKYSGELGFGNSTDHEVLCGEGKEYYDNGNIKYEGTFNLGTIARGKYYDIQGNLRYEGSFYQGIPKGESND